MNHSLNQSTLMQFSTFIESRMALNFPDNRWNDLERKALTAAREFGFENGESFINWLTSSEVSRYQIELLASHLTVSETYFWREPQVYDALVEHILPDIVQSRENNDKRIRIWSAGCSSGEEPYSIAIALHRVIPDLEDWHITILATDINPRILKKANNGVYGEWSFRNAPAWLKESCFLHRDGCRLEILPEIRKMVTFSYLNLAEDIYPSHLNNTGAMDIIFCRNVLMYFTPGRGIQVVHGLYRSLVNGGYLMVSSSELSQHLFSQFDSVNFQGAIAYRKESPGTSKQDVFHFDENLSQYEIIPSLNESVTMKKNDLQYQFLNDKKLQELVSPAIPEAVCARALDKHLNEDKTEDTDKADIYAARHDVMNLIRELADKGNLAEAMIVCNNAIKADKLDPGLHYLKAIIFQEQNSDSEAISSLKQTLYLDPNHTLAHFTLGSICLRSGDMKSAKRCFDNALELVSTCMQEEILPESSGITAGRFREIIQSIIEMGDMS